MSYSLIPKNFLSVPLRNFWEDVEEWLPSQSHPNGLSVSEDDKKIYIEAAIPGVDSKDVEVTFHDGYLWIRGETKKEEEDKKKKYYRKAVNSFSYQVAVPGDVDTKKDPNANCKNGIITISFEKSPKTQPKKIQVK
jgi:HSP20 family protein